MYRTEALKSLREKLQRAGLSAIIIPTNDPHFGEYTQDRFKVRAWLSGFDGSAGTLAVTLKEAALWTDSRYFQQAAAQLQGSGIRLMKLKMEGTPTIAGWILDQYPQGEKVAIDRSLFSCSGYESLCAELSPCKVELIDDLFDDLWKDRPAQEFRPIRYMDTEYTGENTRSKLERVIQALGVKGRPYAYAVTMCDEVAWLCNIRGNDIEYNPLPQSYALILNGKLHLFAALEAMDAPVKAALGKEGVELHPYGSFTAVLAQIPADVLRICSKSAISVRDYQALDIPGAAFMEDPTVGGTVNLLKAVKNSCEQAGFEKANLYDGVAWCKLLKYIDDALAAGEELDEFTISGKFAAFRSENEFYRGESFEPIVAFGPSASLPHYSATREHSRRIGKDNFLLMDTGGHYLFGTTDTTRTIPVGHLTQEMKKNYTLVLKGMIDLSMAKFPKGTRGCQLDILARGPLFGNAAMYFHGTSHGVGHYLCVHEGPQSIRMEENPVTFLPGMVMSNEPAVYIDGEYGIRTENVILVENWKESPMNEFYRFRTLTLVPIDLSPVLWELLDDAEARWVKDLNRNVCDKLKPLLDTETAKWLEEKYQ